MNTKERLLQLAESKGMSKAAFLKKVDLQRGLLDADKMDYAVTDKNLAKVFFAFPDVNMEWLVAGKGAMYKPTLVLPPDTVSIDRYEAKVEECVRLRLQLESITAASNNNSL